VKLSSKSEGEIDYLRQKKKKNSGNLLPVYLPCKECLKKFFREKKKKVRNSDLHKGRLSETE
jgi:hypothetical protein